MLHTITELKPTPNHFVSTINEFLEYDNSDQSLIYINEINCVEPILFFI